MQRCSVPTPAVLAFGIGFLRHPILRQTVSAFRQGTPIATCEQENQVRIEWQQRSGTGREGDIRGQQRN
jgi:hypothetical protein